MISQPGSVALATVLLAMGENGLIRISDEDTSLRPTTSDLQSN